MLGVTMGVATLITVMTIVIASALMVTFQDRVTGFLDEALGQMKL